MNKQEFNQELFNRFCKSLQIHIPVFTKYLQKSDRDMAFCHYSRLSGYVDSLLMDFDIDSPEYSRVSSIAQVVQKVDCYQRDSSLKILERLKTALASYCRDYQGVLA